MKLKYPKKVEIMDYTFNIKYDKTTSGGHFIFSEREIMIGTFHKDRDPVSVFNVICHEVLEIIYELLSLRYQDYGTSQDFTFHMTHKEFQNSTRIFSRTIQQFLE